MFANQIFVGESGSQIPALKRVEEMEIFSEGKKVMVKIEGGRQTHRRSGQRHMKSAAWHDVPAAKGLAVVVKTAVADAILPEKKICVVHKLVLLEIGHNNSYKVNGICIVNPSPGAISD